MRAGVARAGYPACRHDLERSSLGTPAIDLAALQQKLSYLYELDLRLDVQDFLTTDREFVQQLHGVDQRPSKEKLLVHQPDDEQLDVSLYIDAEVLEHLSADNPFVRLHAGNLGDFWLALEGVSHFVYLTSRAVRARQLTLMELELQAEVDKYITSASLFNEQRAGHIPRELHSWLFELPQLDSRLSVDEQGRYYDANRYAGKYCSHLRSQYLDDNRPLDLVRELRRFYHLSQPEKIHRINAVR